MEPSSPSLTKVFGDFLNLQDMLTITLMGAKDLVPKDRNGLSDPYVVVTYPGFTHKSKVKSKTLDPIWNETIQIPLIENSTEGINFRVMDKDMISDDFEGDFTLKLNEITNFSGEIMEFPLKNIEKGFLLISCTLKCYPRPNIQKTSIPSSFKDREQFFKCTRNSWLLGIIKYPMSRTEIGIEIDKSLSKNSSPRQLSNKDRWVEFKLEDHLLDIVTPLETFLENPAFVDRFRVELITCSGKDSNDIREACESHLESTMTKFKKGSSWKSINNNSKSFEMLNGFTGSIILKNKGKELKLTVTGKMYAIYIGHNSILTYSYLSNCASPYESSLEESVFKSMPPKESTLFTSLYCDIAESLWLRHPFGWVYQEKDHSELSYLYSPIHIKKSAIDQIIVEQIPNDQFKPLEELSNQHLNHLISKLNNVKITSPIKKRERSNPSLTVSTTNIAGSRIFYEFEISYQKEDTPLTRIVNLTTTFGRNFWLISYETSTKSQANKDTYESTISQIRFDDSKKE